MSAGYQHKSSARKILEKDKKARESSQGTRTLFDVWKGKGSSSTETTIEAQEEDEPSDDKSEPSLSLQTTEDQGFSEN